ncbi:MAG: FAD-dependent monooxygenase [Betaproteobacteria bacterium]|nr:FAD-dependent monooxygenase [Betaproteobacteria bacterium]
MRADILIIGAGPAGATAATLLARAGRDVVVVEKSTFPRRKVCGEFIAGSGIAVLRELGLEDEFDAAAGPEVRRIAVWAGKRTLEAPMPGDQYPRALERDQLDTMLLDAAVRSGARVVREPVPANTTIRAFGSWQRNAQPKPSDLFGFQAHFSGGEQPPNTIALIPFPGGYGGLVERAQGRSTFACCIRRDRLEAIREQGTGAGESVLRHAILACRTLGDALAGATLDGPWLGAGPLHPGIRPRYADGTYAIGNAAGEAHPVVGEGIAMAMQSGALLTECLLHGGDYERLWHRRFALRLRVSAALAHLAMLPGAPRLAPILGGMPSLLTAAALLSGKRAAS